MIYRCEAWKSQNSWIRGSNKAERNVQLKVETNNLIECGTIVQDKIFANLVRLKHSYKVKQLYTRQFTFLKSYKNNLLSVICGCSPAAPSLSTRGPRLYIFQLIYRYHRLHSYSLVICAVNVHSTTVWFVSG